MDDKIVARNIYRLSNALAVRMPNRSALEDAEIVEGAVLVEAARLAGLDRASLDAMPPPQIRARHDIVRWYHVVMEALLARIADPSTAGDVWMSLNNSKSRRLGRAVDASLVNSVVEHLRPVVGWEAAAEAAIAAGRNHKGARVYTVSQSIDAAMLWPRLRPSATDAGDDIDELLRVYGGAADTIIRDELSRQAHAADAAAAGAAVGAGVDRAGTSEPSDMSGRPATERPKVPMHGVRAASILYHHPAAPKAPLFAKKVRAGPPKAVYQQSAALHAAAVAAPGPVSSLPAAAVEQQPAGQKPRIKLKFNRAQAGIPGGAQHGSPSHHRQVGSESVPAELPGVGVFDDTMEGACNEDGAGATALESIHGRNDDVLVPPSWDDAVLDIDAVDVGL